MRAIMRRMEFASTRCVLGKNHKEFGRIYSFRLRSESDRYIQTPLLEKPGAALGIESYLSTVPMGRLGKPSEVNWIEYDSEEGRLIFATIGCRRRCLFGVYDESIRDGQSDCVHW